MELANKELTTAAEKKISEAGGRAKRLPNENQRE